MTAEGRVARLISDLDDEWYHKSSKEKREAIMGGKWVEFEVAQAMLSVNYTLVPGDFYARLGLLADCAYVSGFADAGGGMFGHKICITNTDQDVLSKISKTLSWCGIQWSLRKMLPPKCDRHTQVHRIDISGFENLVLFWHLIGFSMPRKQGKLVGLIASQMACGRRNCLTDYITAVSGVLAGWSVASIARKLDISNTTLYNRLNRDGWDYPDAVLGAMFAFREKHIDC